MIEFWVPDGHACNHNERISSFFLNRNQVVNKVFSALGIAGVAKDYDKNDALEVLSSGSGILRAEQVILFLPLIRRLV